MGEGIPWLGFTVWPQLRRLKRRQGLHFRRRFQAALQAVRMGALPAAQVTTSVQSWVNHVRYGNTIGLRKAVLGHHDEGADAPRMANGTD
ncbi:MAG: hypothetical protein AB7N91_03850 [Candidatus Tectimicrobiota bacterium]